MYMSKRPPSWQHLLLTEALETLKRFLRLFGWLMKRKKKDSKPPDISQIVSLSPLTFSLSHYSKIWPSARTFSPLCLPLKIHEALLPSAALHWIHLTSPRVWPSHKIQGFAPWAASRPCFRRLSSCFLQLLWPLFISGNYFAECLFLLHCHFVLYFLIFFARSQSKLTLMSVILFINMNSLVSAKRCSCN